VPAAIVRQCRRPRPERQVKVSCLHQLKLRRRNTDDRERLAVDNDGAADDIRCGTEPAAPQCVAQQRHTGRAAAIVVGHERAADLRQDAQHREH